MRRSKDATRFLPAFTLLGFLLGSILVLACNVDTQSIDTVKNVTETGTFVIEHSSQFEYNPDPVDIAPIQEVRHEKTGRSINCKPAKGELAGVIALCDAEYADFTYTTCRDKSRFLMTAEDGSKHCIKFGGENVKK